MRWEKESGYCGRDGGVDGGFCGGDGGVDGGVDGGCCGRDGGGDGGCCGRVVWAVVEKTMGEIQWVKSCFFFFFF